MPGNVRIFGYSGIRQMQQVMVLQYNADSVFLLEEPYQWSQVIALNGATPVSSIVQALDKATLIRIELPDTTSIRYEINPNGPLAVTARLAGNGSPRLSGINNFSWSPGATISMVDAANFP